MKNGNFLFLVFSLVVVSFTMQSYSAFQRYFSPVKEQSEEISALKRSLAVKKIELAKYQNEILDFQHSIAQKSINSNGRSIASVPSMKSSVEYSLDLSGMVLERAKAQFRSKEYSLAIESIKELLHKYPASASQVEAHFFLAESLFLSARGPECLDIIDKMMTQYPESDLTGFIMLRMGQILHKQGRNDEAAEVYHVVENSFEGNFELRQQAQKLGKALE